MAGLGSGTIVSTAGLVSVVDAELRAANLETEFKLPAVFCRNMPFFSKAPRFDRARLASFNRAGGGLSLFVSEEPPSRPQPH